MVVNRDVKKKMKKKEQIKRCEICDEWFHSNTKVLCHQCDDAIDEFVNPVDYKEIIVDANDILTDEWYEAHELEIPNK